MWMMWDQRRKYFLVWLTWIRVPLPCTDHVVVRPSALPTRLCVSSGFVPGAYTLSSIYSRSSKVYLQNKSRSRKGSFQSFPACPSCVSPGHLPSCLQTFITAKDTEDTQLEAVGCENECRKLPNFIIAKICKQPRVSSAGEWLNKTGTSTSWNTTQQW